MAMQHTRSVKGPHAGLISANVGSVSKARGFQPVKDQSQYGCHAAGLQMLQQLLCASLCLVHVVDAGHQRSRQTQPLKFRCLRRSETWALGKLVEKGWQARSDGGLCRFWRLQELCKGVQCQVGQVCVLLAQLPLSALCLQSEGIEGRARYTDTCDTVSAMCENLSNADRCEHN